MCHIGLNKKIIIFICLVPFVLFGWYLKNYAAWGVDIVTYNEQYQLVSFEEPYYLKEFLSWGLINIFGDQFGDAKALSYALDVLLVCLAVNSSRSFLGCFLIMGILLISPPYYLLSLNILRQWLSALILTYCYINYSANRKLAPALLLSILAVFAHNSSIILILLYAICNFNLIVALVLSMGFVALQMIQFDIINPYQDLIFQDINGYSDIFKKYFYLGMVFFQSIASVILTNNKKKFNLAIVSFIITTLPASDWMLERLLLTVLFVSTFELATLIANIKAKISIRAYCYFLLVFSFVVTLMHSGVTTVINGQS